MSKSTLSCASCDKAMWSGRTSRPQGEAICRDCRRSGASVEHGSQYAYRGHKCRCDVCKAAHNARMREYNAKRKERDGVSATTQAKRRAKGVDPIRPQKPCGYCGEMVAMDRGSDVPYHRECRYKVPAWKREGRESPQVEAFRRKIARAALGTSGGGRVWTSGACEWCGAAFVGIGWTCSDKCRESRSYKRYREVRGSSAFRISPADRLAIYERDGWICQICDVPVNPDAHFLDDDSATLDHIEPQSAALIPDHSPENLRTCHRLCNSYRSDGARMTDAQVREIVTARFVLNA